MDEQIQENVGNKTKICMYMAFIDLTKAFDSINREGFWEVLSRFGNSANFITILKLLHDKMTQPSSCTNGKQSLSPPVQGRSRDGLSQFLYSLPTILFLVRDRRLNSCTQSQTLCDKLKEKDMTILMGDLNAKIGSDNSGYEEVMGRQGLGRMNENGEMLADFGAFNNMIIGGSVFPHRRIHKATWVSPDHRTENQIDHICIGRKFRRSMQDVRVQRGADAAPDHHLVLARMKMKLKKREVKRSTRTQYNVDFLQDRVTTETFRLTVKNKYEALQDILDEGNMDIDTQWQQIKEMWTSTCSEVLGKKKYQQKDWISAETVNKVQVRKEKKGAVNNSRTRAAKAAAQEEYTEANRAVKNSVKTDKANFIEDLAKEAEDASAQGNMKQLYDITRKLAGKYKNTDRPIKDKNGNVLTSDEDQLKRWREHFEELLNRPPPQNPPDIAPAEEVLQINCERPSKA